MQQCFSMEKKGIRVVLADRMHAKTYLAEQFGVSKMAIN